MADAQDTPPPEEPAELDERELDKVSGGATLDVCKSPTPSGPVPIPYPSTSTAK